MPVSINQFQKPKSTIDVIADALNVAHQIYGIKADSAALDLHRQQQDELSQKLLKEKSDFSKNQKDQAESDDPNSAKSDMARKSAASYLNVVANSTLGKKNPEAFSPLLSLANDPKTTASQLNDAFEKSPLLKYTNALAAKDQGSEIASAVWGNRKELQQERMDQMAHQKTIQSIRRDPQLTKRIANYQNLENAMSNITNADNLTPQQIAEVQQTIRGSLGIGAGGVGEREHSYINSLGLNFENMKQFISGDPATISKDSKLIEHFKDLARIEQGNIGRQMEKRLSAVSAGNRSMYERRPDLKADLLDAVNSFKDQYAQEQSPQAAPASQPSTAIIPDANAGSSSKVTAEDLAAYQFAISHPEDPRSQHILAVSKSKGLGK